MRTPSLSIASLFALVFCLGCMLPAFAQAPAVSMPAAAQRAVSHKIDNEFVQQQFGDQFTLLPEFGAAFGDLDGDGVEDIVIAARCKNPMLDQGEHNYAVIDPYNDFFGYGDPRMTTTFSEGDPRQRGLVVLVIDGAGVSAWRNKTPKAKYVIVNLPFKTMSVRRFKTRKRSVEAIYVEEAGEMGTSSALFFDGKKFRYVPMGGDMQ
ncbi:MAG TPA: hypothetical protein VIH78_07430 [Terriglobales bacterium]